ncbi:hypothetical protein N0B44_06420 [Roseibacterium beibuensis]|uniref:hypothetical protein n=1 Tax=[Roseibacterium] beibuensis TaxID=1193142 RepID=UPI00217DC4F3|nr:hypothetical protein [Roseibacterium beibuensis]MCS6622536.1 hypothetical protein [Roseibacterium beibuensis]
MSIPGSFRPTPAATLLAVVALAAPAYGVAQTPDPSAIPVLGHVRDLCLLGEPQIRAAGAVNLGVMSGETITLASLVDDALQTRATRFDIEMPALCNTPHRVVVSSDNGGLWNAGAAVAGDDFGVAVPYTLTLDWSGRSLALNAPAVTPAPIDMLVPVDQAAGDRLVLEFNIDAGASNAGANTPLAAGVYRDTVRVSLGVE